MNNYLWLKEKDYVDNMTKLSKVCYWLNLLKYQNQQVSEKLYTGRFRFYMGHPLTWIIFAIVFIIIFFCGLLDIIICSIKETLHLIKSDVKVELNKKYKSKYE